MKNLILIGGGGHCKSCIDVIESVNEYLTWSKVLKISSVGELNDEIVKSKPGEIINMCELVQDNRLQYITKMILENEIRVNIQRVAEGHLDLSRNLHEAMKPNNTMEMLQIQVSVLESKVKELERKVS